VFDGCLGCKIGAELGGFGQEFEDTKGKILGINEGVF